jgi:hypothetical protein
VRPLGDMFFPVAPAAVPVPFAVWVPVDPERLSASEPNAATSSIMTN